MNNVIRIEDWYFTLEPGNPYAAPETRKPLISGKIFGSSRIEEGGYGAIDLSRIVKRVENILYSVSGNKYEVGTPNLDYESVFPDAKNRILAHIPNHTEDIELPEVTTLYTGSFIVQVAFFSEKDAYPSMYALLVPTEGKYELAKEGNRGLKVFLNRASRDMIYEKYKESDPELFIEGGEIQINDLGLRITGYAESKKAAHGELIP